MILVLMMFVKPFITCDANYWTNIVRTSRTRFLGDRFDIRRFPQD